jgi:GrpB-like predicted nucleotidyltransferase (UPF0157 family)
MLMSPPETSSNIGIRRNLVELRTHDPRWLVVGGKISVRLQQAAGQMARDVQHVGSTAVPDLKAKPLIDIALGLRRADDVPALVPILENLGYIYRGDAGEDGGHLFVYEIAPDVRSVHVHAVDYQGRQWREYLAFRDTLNRDLGARRRYEQVKEELVAKHGLNRTYYTSGKQDVVLEILKSVESVKASG